MTRSWILVASRSHFFGRLANLPPVAAKEAATMDVREIQTIRGASIIAADLDDHAESLDSVAGSEFVDDRIRLRE